MPAAQVGSLCLYRFSAGAAFALLLVTGLASAYAQNAAPPTPEQQKELQLVALAKARTELLDRVRALAIAPNVTVGEWLVRDAGLDRALRLWIRTQPRQGNVRLYSDAVCEADVRVEPPEVSAELIELLKDYPASATALGLDEGKLKAAARAWPLLWATGRATVSKHRPTDQPPGWEDVSREGLELARGAATADAYHALLAEAGRLKVTNARRLHEFLDSSEAVSSAVQTEIQRAVKAKVTFDPDQVAVAEVRLSMRDLLRILTRAHQEHYRGEEFEAADFREMTLLAGKDDLVGTGLATPPGHTLLRSRYAAIEYDAPKWAATTMTATGRVEPADGETPDKATLHEAARLDAVTRLSLQIEGLVIQKSVTVADFLSYYQDLKDDVALFLSGARPVALPTTLPAGGVEVKVELPLRRLWEIVRRDMKVEEVEPADATTEGTLPAAPTTAPAKETP